MIKNAWKYEDTLRKLFLDTWYDDKYKYYSYMSYNDVYKNPEETEGDWTERRFVSCIDGIVIGFIGYSINREAYFAHNFNIVMFSDSISAKVEFMKDVFQVISDAFYKFNLNKIKFNVIVGNPAERMYDKFINDFRGYVIGVCRCDVKLSDNKLYDVKMYELYKQNFVYTSDEIKKKYYLI